MSKKVLGNSHAVCELIGSLFDANSLFEIDYMRVECIPPGMYPRARNFLTRLSPLFSIIELIDSQVSGDSKFVVRINCTVDNVYKRISYTSLSVFSEQINMFTVDTIIISH